MFDSLKIEMALPDLTAEQVVEMEWQTKSLGCAMDDYTLRADGQLVLHAVRWEPVPEEERPYWGKPEWGTKKIVRIFGSMKVVPVGDVESTLTGTIRFYASRPRMLRSTDVVEWYEYEARLTDGRVTSPDDIRRLPNRR